MHYILNAVIFGFSIVIIGNLISYFMCNFASDKEDAICNRNINKKHIIDILLFITGLTTFIIYEKIGIFKNYCNSLK